MMHHLATSHVGEQRRLARATTLLDAGASLDKHDPLLESTPLDWACRWGRSDLVQLYLSRGADVWEPDAEPWPTPLAGPRRGIIASWLSCSIRVAQSDRLSTAALSCLRCSPRNRVHRASVRHTDAPSGLPRVLSWLGRLSCRNTGSHLNGRHLRPVNAYIVLVPGNDTS